MARRIESVVTEPHECDAVWRCHRPNAGPARSFKARQRIAVLPTSRQRAGPITTQALTPLAGIATGYEKLPP
jgi:hypothetical protein